MYIWITLLTAVSGTPCQAATFIAGKQSKVLTSPYFPDTIHAKTQCEWEIKAPKGKRVQISFDVLELLNHRTNGRCTTQSLDIIDGPRIRDVKNDAISLCGKKKPLTDFVTDSNVARIRIVSDYYGENMNNKFKLRYKATSEPANFKGYSNDVLVTSKSGFVVRQSAVSNEKRVPSGPKAEALQGNNWGKANGNQLKNVQKNRDGRVTIRSGGNFKPRVKVKAVPTQSTGPTQHVPPPQPGDIQSGYVYQGPDHIPDPNQPLNQQVGGDPWNTMMPTPPPDVLNNGYVPEVIVRPAGWLDIDGTDTDYEDYEDELDEPSQLQVWMKDLGLDINPWFLLVGAGGVVIFIVGIFIAKSIKNYREGQKLEKLQLEALARGPQGITTITGYKSGPIQIPVPMPVPIAEPPLSPPRPIDLSVPPAGFREKPDQGPSSHIYNDVDVKLQKACDKLDKLYSRRYGKNDDESEVLTEMTASELTDHTEETPRHQKRHKKPYSFLAPSLGESKVILM